MESREVDARTRDSPRARQNELRPGKRTLDESPRWMQARESETDSAHHLRIVVREAESRRLNTCKTDLVSYNSSHGARNAYPYSENGRQQRRRGGGFI